MDQIEFLKDIWDHNEGVVFLAFKPKSGGIFKYGTIELPISDESASRIKETIAEYEETHHCFYTPAIFANETSVTSPTKDSVVCSKVSWVDVDDEYAAEQIQKDPPEGASYLINSGRGVHVLWKGPYDTTNLEHANQQWIEQYKGDRGTWNANRLLRIPGTRNWKHEGAPTASVIKLNGSTVTMPMGPVVGQEKKSAELHILDLEAIKLTHALPDKLTSYFLGEIDPDDRSAALWEIARLCKESKLNIHEAYTVLMFFESQWHKYGDRAKVELERILNKEYRAASKIRGLLRTFSQIHQTDAKVDWLITNGVTREGLMILSGPPGVGKTQFSLRTITRAFAENHMIANMGLKPMRVLYLSLEMSEGELAYFTQQMKFTPEEQAIFDEYITFYAPGESLYLNKKEDQSVFNELILEVNPELVLIDTLGSALSGELTSEEIVRPAMDYLDKTRHEYHTAIWFNHHQRKATAENKKPTKLSDLYGSMYISARATSVFCLYPANEDQSELEFITLKNRFAKIGPSYVLTRTDNLDFFLGSEGVEKIAGRAGHGDKQSGSNNGQGKATGGSSSF